MTQAQAKAVFRRMRKSISGTQPSVVSSPQIPAGTNLIRAISQGTFVHRQDILLRESIHGEPDIGSHDFQKYLTAQIYGARNEKSLRVRARVYVKFPTRKKYFSNQEIIFSWLGSFLFLTAKILFKQIISLEKKSLRNLMAKQSCLHCPRQEQGQDDNDLLGSGIATAGSLQPDCSAYALTLSLQTRKGASQWHRTYIPIATTARKTRIKTAATVSIDIPQRADITIIITTYTEENPKVDCAGACS